MLGGSDCYDGRSDSSDYRCEFTYFSADLNLSQNFILFRAMETILKYMHEPINPEVCLFRYLF